MESGKRVLLLLAMAVVVLTGMELDAVIGCGAAAETDVLVFAAASTTNAITEIGELYAAQHPGRRITPSFASSSTLAKQIESGAPADVFLSANQKWMDYLEEKNRIPKGSRFDLLGNRIVLVAPVDSSLKQIDVAPGFSLAAALGTDGRLSMGDPRSCTGRHLRQESPRKPGELEPGQGSSGSDERRARGAGSGGAGGGASGAGVCHRCRHFPKSACGGDVSRRQSSTHCLPRGRGFRRQNSRGPAIFRVFKIPGSPDGFEKYGFSVR